jgi:hypothetical protein
MWISLMQMIEFRCVVSLSIPNFLAVVLTSMGEVDWKVAPEVDFSPGVMVIQYLHPELNINPGRNARITFFPEDMISNIASRGPFLSVKEMFPGMVDESIGWLKSNSTDRSWYLTE